MNDLRSLEGVAHALASKITIQQQSAIISKPRAIRSKSVPKTNSSVDLSLNDDFGITISTYLPIDMIRTGYNQNPKLINGNPVFQKSISEFQHTTTPDDIKKLIQENLNNDNYPANYDPNDKITHVPVFSSPSQSMSPNNSIGYPPISLDNNATSFSSYSHRNNSIRLTKSPSIALGHGALGGTSLKLDLTDLYLSDNDIDIDTQYVQHVPVHKTSFAQLPPLMSPDLDNINPDPDIPLQQPIAPPYPLRKTYSNNSLFTLFSGDDVSTSETELQMNTKLNSAIGVIDPTITKSVSDNTSDANDNDNDDDDADDVLIDLKKEDFMEYIENNTNNNASDIGSGASGIVRKAFHLRSCKMVAIKQCRSKVKHEQNAFEKEAKLYLKFNNKCSNIIDIYGFGRDDENGNLCMAIEYMDLKSIDKLGIDTYPDPKRESIVGHIAVNILNALNILHNGNIKYIHNDIKPANILSNKYGEIKLSDFGTVLELTGTGSNAFSDKNNGTQIYQSPEKLINDPIKYNTKSDIWSFGVTLYELLFGGSYADDDNVLKYVNNPPKLSNATHKVSDPCCDFVNKCLIVDYKQRYSAQQLLLHPFIKKMNKIQLLHKWPWLHVTQKQHVQPCAVSNAVDMAFNVKKKVKFDADIIDKNQKKKTGKTVKFGADIIDKNKKKKKKKLNNNNKNNEDLLFMISALIIYYSTQSFKNDHQNGSFKKTLHRRVSNFDDKKYNPDDINDDNDDQKDNNNNNLNNRKAKAKAKYTDEERINNIAKYALCSKEIVEERIRVTVSYIKSQLNSIK